MSYEQFWQPLTMRYDAGEAKAIARMVLDVAFGMSMADILCGKVTQLSADESQKLRFFQQRLLNGEPVQYVLGCADFCQRMFHVDSSVLIPRPETAELCRWIVEREAPRAAHVLDIGTGSGCIAITLALDIPGSRVTAWDISTEALRTASRNAEALGAEVRFEQRDALRPAGSPPHAVSPAYDIIVSNPPYIYNKERAEMQQHVLDHEPQTALFAPGDNPMLFYDSISRYAAGALRKGGALYFELNPLIARDVAACMQASGLAHATIRCDQFGKQRFIRAEKI